MQVPSFKLLDLKSMKQKFCRRKKNFKLLLYTFAAKRTVQVNPVVNGSLHRDLVRQDIALLTSELETTYNFA